MCPPSCKNVQACISPSLKITWILSCGERCIDAPALVSAASPSGAETVLESVAVDSNHCISPPGTFINGWILSANSEVTGLQCAACYCVLCVSRTQTIYHSLYSSHPHVSSVSISLCSLCFPPVDPLFVSRSLCFPSQLFCSAFISQTKPALYPTLHAHTALFIYSVSPWRYKIYSCIVRFQYVLIWIPLQRYHESKEGFMMSYER